jgi:hypothetical protein
MEQGAKTHQSRRVTLVSGTVGVLADHRVWSEENAKLAGTAITKQSFVFSHAVDGSTPWRPDSTTRAFRSLCDEAGVSGSGSMISVTMLQPDSSPPASTCGQSEAGSVIETQPRRSTCTPTSSLKPTATRQRRLRRYSEMLSRDSDAALRSASRISDLLQRGRRISFDSSRDDVN